MNEELTTDKTGKAIMAMFSVTDIIGRLYVAPPGTPAEIMNILREAFDKVTEDPQLKEDSKKMMMDVEYTPAEGVLKNKFPFKSTGRYRQRIFEVCQVLSNLTSFLTPLVPPLELETVS